MTLAALLLTAHCSIASTSTSKLIQTRVFSVILHHPSSLPSCTLPRPTDCCSSRPQTFDNGDDPDRVSPSNCCHRRPGSSGPTTFCVYNNLVSPSDQKTFLRSRPTAIRQLVRTLVVAKEATPPALLVSPRKGHAREWEGPGRTFVSIAWARWTGRFKSVALGTATVELVGTSVRPGRGR